MALRTEIYELPSLWASALINNDFSSLSVDEIYEVMSWRQSMPHLGDAIEVSHTIFIAKPDIECYGVCECLEYTFPVINN